MVRASIIAMAVLASGAGVARAQEQVMPPLADVARQAEASKANAKKAKKTYTNANLTADPRGETTTVPAAAAKTAAAAAVANASAAKPAPAGATTVPADAKTEGEPEKESEESWRARAAGLRTQVERMGARLQDLITPNRLADENPGVKAATDVEAKNTRDALDRLRKQWERLEASAVQSKIPSAWIQPQPVFPQ